MREVAKFLTFVLLVILCFSVGRHVVRSTRPPEPAPQRMVWTNLPDNPDGETYLEDWRLVPADEADWLALIDNDYRERKGQKKQQMSFMYSGTEDDHTLHSPKDPNCIGGNCPPEALCHGILWGPAQ